MTQRKNERKERKEEVQEHQDESKGKAYVLEGPRTGSSRGELVRWEERRERDGPG